MNTQSPTPDKKISVPDLRKARSYLSSSIAALEIYKLQVRAVDLHIEAAAVALESALMEIEKLLRTAGGGDL